MADIKRPTTEDGRNLEIERKYLIEYPDIKWLESIPGIEKVNIKQTYLNTAKEKKLRVRIWKVGKDVRYILTRKTKISDTTRIEEESQISKEEYERLLSSAVEDMRDLEKIRYRFPYNDRTVEVDIFPFWEDRALAEVEMESEDEEVILPSELKVLREVTEDKRYTNYNLALSKGNL